MKTAKPLQFFLITYLWSWILWAPFVLAGMGLYSLNDDLYAAISFPVLMLGALGPAVGAIICVYNVTIIMETDVFQTRFWLHEFLFLIIGAIFLLSYWIKYLQKAK